MQNGSQPDTTKKTDKKRNNDITPHENKNCKNTPWHLEKTINKQQTNKQ